MPLISWAHWFTFFNIIAALGLSSFYLISETFPDTLLGQIYFVVNWLSHISFLVFMCFVLILFPLILILPKTRFIRASASFIYTFILLLMLLDAFVYNQLGYHLNASSSGQVIDLIVSLIEKNNRLFWFVSLLLCLVLLSVQFVVSNYAWKHLRQLQKTTFARKIIFALVSTFCFSHIIHIWADAKLDYDILRQDSFLPLTYPATAKTLLTKYGMFNKDDYIKRKTAPLSFSESIPNYPNISQGCSSSDIKRSVFMILTKNMLSNGQIEQISQRSTNSAIKLNNHIDNAMQNNAWFNLFYALPSIYQKDILVQQTAPLLFQAIDNLQLDKTLTVIGEQTSSADGFVPWHQTLFSQQTQLDDISSLVFADKLNNLKPGLHVVYFNDDNDYQFELFMDALLLAQKQKKTTDIIWVSSLGNIDKETSFIGKPALLILPEKKSATLAVLTSQMDIAPTLLKHWLKCDVNQASSANGTDLLKINHDRVIGNTMNGGIMAFSKDKSVFIDQHGNFQSYSQQLEAPITVDSDFPLMIEAVHFIKLFANQAKSHNKATNAE